MSDAAIKAIEGSVSGGIPVLVSPITAWERGLLAAKGKIASPITPHRWFELLLSQHGVELAEMSIDILIDSSFLPGQPQGDATDRIIIATARALELTVVTRDRAILDYAALGHVRALAC